MRRRGGSNPRSRLVAMRFALWASQVPQHLLTARQVSGLLDISLGAAKRLLRDYNAAAAPMHYTHVPPFLTPDPERLLFPSPATTGTTCSTRTTP